MSLPDFDRNITNMIKYREEFRLWWPEYDDRAASTFRTLKNHARYAKSVQCYARGFKLAVQAGGFVGLWPRLLNEVFSRVVTFEPDEACYEALLKNTTMCHIEAHHAALSKQTGEGWMIPSKCSCWKFTWDANAKGVGPKISTLALDTLDLDYCDAIVLDVEGSELDALEGARETIGKFQPVIQLEVWEENQAEYEVFMKALGYKTVERVGNDLIYIPNSMSR